MSKQALAVLRRVELAWEEAIVSMRQMYGSSSVKPTFHEAFSIDYTAPPGEVWLNIAPIVFNVPERANSGSPDLYIVVTGRLSFEGPDFTLPQLKTKGFATEIGYFRSKQDALHHIYGAHYDMAEGHRGHPVFHAQMKPFDEFGDDVLAKFELEQAVDNKIAGVLRTVRTPSAQMDVFAVLTQICADHLIWEDSADEVLNAFNSLRAACGFVQGAAYRMAYLTSVEASSCYRGPHWYGV